jgi:phospholipid/cholesterol/gamma-HCH transport system substrate-binding protein
LGIAGIVVAAVVTVSILLGGTGTSYEVRALVENAGQLVKGNLVKVGGVTIGSVDGIELGDRNQAELRLTITDEEFAPLHVGTRAVIRSTSLSAVAGRLVILEPGPNDGPKIPDGGTIPATNTQPIVDLDQVLNTFDAEARSSLQDVIHGSARLYSSNTAEANRGLEALNPALSQTTRTLAELMRDERTFERFVVEASSVAGAVGRRDADLESGIANGAAAAAAVARENGALDDVLRRTPDVLRRANTTLANARRALVDLRPAVHEARPVAPRLARLLRGLEPLTRRAKPVVADVRGLLPDAQRALMGLPALDQVARPALASTVTTLRDAQEIVSAARAYAPDVVAGLFNGFGGTTGGYYDANGHYVRISLQGNQYTLSNAASLVTLPPQDNPLQLVRKGLYGRCPGAATQSAPDKSNPWTTEAPCKPEDSPK